MNEAESLGIVCDVCPRGCFLEEGQRGFCGARRAEGDRVVCESYGRITALALDPIEKKPLTRFHPGGRVLSVGSYGCNMVCPFCQNHEIARGGAAQAGMRLAPDELAARAAGLREVGNIGLAFTYNEPMVGYEYVLDAARLCREKGMLNVMVTNGYCRPAVMEALLEVVDAFNIDLKCFTEVGYRSLGGELGTVKDSIRAAAAGAHVEVTTLAVPALSDGVADMEAQAAWLAEISPEIPLHISRYYPRWRATAAATPPETLYALERAAKKHLRHVYLGNV